MESEISTFDRRMKILAILFSGKQVSRLELARWFSVSDVSICRDITALSRIVPIGSKMGRYGGVYLADNYIEGYKIIKLYLSQDEEAVLYEAMENFTGTKKILLESILHKFSMPLTEKPIK